MQLYINLVVSIELNTKKYVYEVLYRLLLYIFELFIAKAAIYV